MSSVSLSIVADARTLSPSEFCRKHPYPFLVTEDIVDAGREIDAEAATTRLPRGVAQAALDTSAFPREIVPVRRRDDSPSDTVTVGRALDVDIQLGATTTSKDHAAFLLSGAGWALIDHASQNGSFVQGERLPVGKERVLTDGDSIAFGPDMRFRFFDARTLYHMIRGFVAPKAF